MLNKMLILFLTIILTCCLQINGNDADGLRLPFEVKIFQTRPPVVPSHAIKPAERWKLGIVPYLIDVHRFDYILTDKIRDAMGVLEQETCLKFQPLIAPFLNGSWYLNITIPDDKHRECVHDTDDGDEGATHLRIGYDCLKQPQLLHSLMHAVGMQDEVNHPQRDKYIRIMWENIKPKYRALFRIRRDMGTQGLYEYDPSSVTHFHDRAFSRNGQATIVPLMAGLQIRPSGELSLLDKQKLQGIYADECNKRKVVKLMHSCKHAMKDQASHQLLSNRECFPGGNQDGQNPNSQKLFWANMTAQNPMWTNWTGQKPLWDNMTAQNPMWTNVTGQKPFWANMTAQNPMWTNWTGQKPFWANMTAQNPMWTNWTGQKPLWDNMTAQNPMWTNVTGQKPFWANMTAQNPMWTNWTGQKPFWANMTAQNPMWTNVTGQKPFWANMTAQKLAWANMTAQNPWEYKTAQNPSDYMTLNKPTWANATLYQNAQNDELSSKEVGWANITAKNVGWANITYKNVSWANKTRLSLGNDNDPIGTWGNLPRTNAERRKNMRRKLRRY